VIKTSIGIDIGGLHVPALITREEGAPRSAAVLFLHGLSSSKEIHDRESTSLARAGLTAVALDAPHHGARRSPLLDAIMEATGAPAHAILLRMLREAIGETSRVVDYLLREGYGPIGIAGISMGAFAALGAAAAEPRLAAVVSILGSPDWWPVKGEIDDAVRPWLAEAPARHPERFPPRPLLIANAGRDENVPPEPARRFAEALRPYYAPFPDRLRYIEYPESGHFMREPDWNDLWHNTVEWLVRHLRPGGPI
jgi:pimeloyl-ACP methyl ester carboxylesterase